MKRTAKKPNMYFSEKDVINLVKEYKTTKSNASFKKIKPSIVGMIDGMVNKEFFFNDTVKNNRSDISSECFLEILKSLERYDPDKGRVFAYFNRIVKNTILRFYYRSKKVNDKEISYTSVSRNQDSVLDDEVVLNLDVGSSYRNEEVFDEQENFTSISSKKKFGSVESYYIIYRYLKNLKDNVDLYINSEELKNDLLVDIKTDPHVSFDYSKYINDNVKGIMSDRLVFTRILVFISNTLSEIIVWTEKKHKFSIDQEPANYSAQIPKRSLSSIRNYVNESLMHSKLTEYYDIEDVIKLIQYIMDRNLKHDLSVDDHGKEIQTN